MIRRLDPDRDVDFYRRCWDWYQSLPEWAREPLTPYSVETFEEFVGLAGDTRANIGVFTEGEMVGVITLETIAPGVYELHLSTTRHPPKDVLLEAMINVIRIGFEELNAKVGFSFTPHYDRGIIAMLRAVGLRQDGVEKLRGTSRGRVVRWIRSIITREDYERDTKTDADPIGNRTVFANRQLDNHEHAGGEYARYQSAA